MQLEIEKTINGLLEFDHPTTRRAAELIRALATRPETPQNSDLVVDLLKNTVTRSGHVVRLTPHEAVILFRLQQALPDAATPEQLQQALYGRMGAARGNLGTLRVHLTDLRRRLAPIRVWIQNRKGKGYQLTFAPF